MDNVPSSAILAIVAIVAACILGAFIFTTVQSQKEAGNQAVNKTEEMNTSLDESTYTQYDGATVTGSQVAAAIKLMKNDGVAVIVSNGNSVTSYLRELTGVKVAVANGKTTITDADKAELRAVTSGKEKSGDCGAAAASEQSGSGTELATYSDLIKKAKDKSQTDSYITPSSSYVGQVIRSESNGSIIGVVFSKQ